MFGLCKVCSRARKNSVGALQLALSKVEWNENVLPSQSREGLSIWEALRRPHSRHGTTELQFPVLLLGVQK
jgi:hypothetical protein